MNEVKFPEPLHSGVIIKRVKLKIEDKLLLPDSSKSAQNEGIVMAVGPDCIQKIKVGTRVLYNQLANQFIIHEGETYHIMSERDVYAEIKTDEHGVEYPCPYNMWLFVKSNQREIKLNTGVIILEGQKVANFGEVIGAGESCKWVKKGHRVLYSFYMDHEVMFRTQVYTFMSEVDVQAILPKEDIIGIDHHTRERRPDVPLDKLPESAPVEEVKGTVFFDPNKK